MPHVHESRSEPTPFLVENIRLLPKGRVLDIAMGNGRNAVYLARLDFQIEGVDISAEAISQALETAKKAGVIIKAVVADLEKDYRIPEDTYDVIICFNYLQRSLIPQIKRGIRRGGMVVYETFLVEQAQWHKPTNPDFLLKHNELLDLFQELRVLRYREDLFTNDKGDQRAIASIVVQRV